jgi:fatty-acid desaturase
MESKTKLIIGNFLHNPCILPVQILGLYPLYLLISGDAVSWWWCAFLPGYICLFTLGISAGYHRLISHKAFTTSTFFKRAILFFGILSGQGSPITWVAIHRGYHHKYSDTDKDLHSPMHGFWHSYITWMFKTPKIGLRSVGDLQRDTDIIFAHKNFVSIFFITNIIVACIDINLWMYLLLLPAWVAFQTISITTSFNHIECFGYKNKNCDDTSVNCVWLWPLIFGDAWHNNHHMAPKSANMRVRWWELDPTYWLIKLIKTS